jgi:hypothetical protein
MTTAQMQQIVVEGNRLCASVAPAYNLMIFAKSGASPRLNAEKQPLAPSLKVVFRVVSE